MGDPIADAAKYFGQKKAGKDPTVNKMEEAAGLTPTPTPPPPPPPKNEGSTVAPPAKGNERTYKDQASKDTATKKSWWPW